MAFNSSNEALQAANDWLREQAGSSGPIGEYEELKRGYEARIQEILQGYQQMYGEVAGLGEAARGDIEAAYGGAESRGEQDLISSGMYGTGALQGMRRGVAADKSRAYGRLNEQLTRERLGVRSQELGFRERVNQAPDYGYYSSLLQSLGSGGSFDEGRRYGQGMGIGIGPTSGGKYYGYPESDPLKNAVFPGQI